MVGDAVASVAGDTNAEVVSSSTGAVSTDPAWVESDRDYDYTEVHSMERM